MAHASNALDAVFRHTCHVLLDHITSLQTS